MTRRSKRWFRSSAPSKKRAEQAYPPKDGSAVSRASGLLGRLRQCRWRPGMRRLYPNAWYRASMLPAPVFKGAATRPVSRSSRRRISASTSASLMSISRPLQLDGTALRPHLGGRGEKNLHVSIGKDDGPDIATIEHGAGRRPPETALKAEQRAAHFGNGRDHRSRLADGRALQGRLVETGSGPAPRRQRPRGRGCPASDLRRAMPSPPRGRSDRYPGAASRNARQAACRACPCRRPPARRSR